MEKYDKTGNNSERVLEDKPHGDFGGKEISPRARRARKRKTLKIVLVCLISLLVLIAGTGVAVIMPLLQAYNSGYEKIPLVTRTGEYFIPEFPTDTGTFETWGDTDFVEDTSSEPATDDDPSFIGGEVQVNGIYKVKQKDPDVINILLVGTDSRDMSSLKGRSDTMMICSYNKRTGEAKLISLLRDTLVPIEGYDANGDGVDHDWNRLNATYSFGGIALCINTINQIFDLDIQRFVIVNFDGTIDLINSCNGVDMTLTSEEVEYIEWSGGEITKNADGTYHLDGQAALHHMRHRKGSSDFTRTQRQRNTLTALFRQVVASRDLTEIYDLVRMGFGMIKTNIPLDEMIDLAASVVSNGSNMSISSHRMPTSYTGIYFKISTQTQVSKGQGGASVLKIDLETQTKKLHQYIYGK